jgi:signal transduction histidine kinase/ligand-binding sensor domain-containing protein/CheY-like chemotaxis protein/AraC-like DNA-binding protein
MTSLLLAAHSDFSITHLGVESGLSNNHVLCVTQDKQGFIWVATEEGLNRFDGHTFKAFFKDGLRKGTSLTGNELNAIMDDAEQPVLWIATQRSGLNAYDYEADSFKAYQHDEADPSSLATNDVTSLAKAADGGIWVTTFWRGIDHLDPSTGKFTHYNSNNVKGLPDAPVWSVVDNGDGFLFVGHERHGFSVVDLHHMKATNYMPVAGDENSLPSEDVWCVYKDLLSNIWVGTSAGLALFHPDESTFVNIGKWHPDLSRHVSDVRQFSDQRLWVAMERGGVSILELTDNFFAMPEKGVVQSISSEGSAPRLSSPSIRCLFEDINSNVWAGSWGGGLNLITDESPVFEYHASTPVKWRGEVNSANCVFTVLVDNDGELWIGKDGGGIDVYSGNQKVRNYSIGDAGMPGDVVQASYKSDDGVLWFGFFNGGAAWFDPGDGRFHKIFPEGSRVDVRDITSDHNGNIIVASSLGVWRYIRKEHRLDGPYDVGNNLIRKVFMLDGSHFLVGTFGSGMVLTDSHFRELRTFDMLTGFPSNTINDIFQSRDGHIWVASGEGLLEFEDLNGNPEKFKVINRAGGLTNSHIQAIAQDRSGNIWVSTNGGISCIKGETVRNYTYRDNLPLGNFLGRSVASDRQGNLYFGALSGLCVFNPVKVLEPSSMPQAFIVELSLLGNASNPADIPTVFTVAGRKEIKLSPKNNSFEIFFSSRDYARAGEVEYSYKLEGLDERWIMARDGNVATFLDLDPGTYVFKVRSRMRNQEWGEAAEVKIILPPPFWLTWWAKTFYMLLILAIGGGLLYLYRKQIKAEMMLKVERINSEERLKAEKERHLREHELNDERLRFYTNITHELRTPLTLIMGPLDDMERSDNLPEKERRSVRMVQRNARRLLDLVNRLLEFRKTETQNRRLCVRRGNAAATVYEVALKYKELNRNSTVKVVISTESERIDGVYDKEVMTVILDNLLSNALKYTDKGEVRVNCTKEGNKLVLSVADTGKGISPEAIPHIFERYYQERGPHQAAGTGIGLALVKNLVTLHHGVLSVKSKLGEGAEFIVVIPIDDCYPEALHTEEPVTESGSEAVTPEENVTVPNNKPVILMVEDNEDIRDYVKESFTDLYDVRCAANGKEGWEMAVDLMPAVVVSDIMMPVMDGIELTRRLKSDIRTSHIPVILLTAKETPSDREEGYASGADSYLTKPFSTGLLQTRITNLLLQRMHLTEFYASQPEAAPENSDNSLKEKHDKLLNALSEIDREFVEQLTKTIHDHLPTENVDVNFLAGACGMSTSTLYRKVKAVTGVSPNEFIRKVKMQMAESLLLSGKFTFSEISFKIGINNPAYFRQCFKETFGMTPTEYLRKVNEEGNRH